jgi:homoserine dehydrogenase
MSSDKQLVIGLFGFGVVGEGLYKVLQQTPSLNGEIRKVCIKHPDKKRAAPASLFTTDKNELLNDETINVIVEVIDDADAAFDIVTTALRNGKAVVSASKKMIAEHLPALLQLQQETGLPFLYESAACASIPVIRNLEEYYDNDLLHSIQAIVNGSTNFILTRIFEDQLDFSEALRQAQEAGFAESDPRLDVEGYDAVNKWTFLLTHAYGIVVPSDRILFNGIQNVQRRDAQVAREKGRCIKLVAQAKKLNDGTIAAVVLPQFVALEDPLAFVKNEYNGVVIESGFADKQFFYGKGAGSFPTASAVLSDISALRYDYKYEYKKLYNHQPSVLSEDFYLRVFVSYSEGALLSHRDFEWIEESYSGPSHSYFTGVIHLSKLKNTDWWKHKGVSLILLPDALLEEGELQKYRPAKTEAAWADAFVYE